MATSGLLLRALNDTGDPPMRPLPDQVARLLQDLDAPPRLAAHLRAVHDVACQLTDWIAQRYPALPLDCDAVLFKRLAEASGRSPWEEFLGFDDLLTSIGNDSGRRLAFQASYPCATPAEGTRPVNRRAALGHSLRLRAIATAYGPVRLRAGKCLGQVVVAVVDSVRDH